MTTEIDARRKKKKDDDKSFRGDARRQQMIEQGITRPGGSGSGRHKDKSKYRRKTKHRRDYAASDEEEDFDPTSYAKPGVQRKPYEKNTQKKKQQKGQEKWDDKRYYRQNKNQILREQEKYRDLREPYLRQRRRSGRHWKYPWLEGKKSSEIASRVVAQALQQPFKVAVIQHHPKFLDRDFNRWELGALVMRAALLDKAKVIVLPELCTTGYTMDKVEAGSVSEPIKGELRYGETTRYFAKLSKKLGVYVAFGLAELGGWDKEGLPILYNSQVMVGPEGTVLGIYRKQNLWGSDWMWATRGPLGKPPIIETPYGRLGMLICKDVRDKAPNGQELYKTGDADIVCLSTNWGNGEFPSGVWMKFTKQNQCWLMISNRWGGPEKHNNFDGGSAVISPAGEVFTFGLEMRSNCIVTHEIDPGKF
jgi:predicted amidohydrolase